MKMLRFAIVGLLTASMSGAPAFAGELRDSVAAAAQAAAASASQTTPAPATGSSPSALKWAGFGLFAGGMAYGLFSFINNENGAYSEFGEADATNVKGGALGLGTAFAGGMLMLLSHRSQSKMPSLTFGKQGVGVAKSISW
jgi:hypothetical protein